MRWDGPTILLIALAVLGLGLAVHYAGINPGVATFGAAVTAGAGVLVLLRGTVEGMLATAPPAPEPAAPAGVARGARLARDPFARHTLYGELARMTIRGLGADRWSFSASDEDRICAMPPAEFRRWVEDRLDELERST